MPICWHNGKILFKNGKVVFAETAEDCCDCCGPRQCCTFDPVRTLYLTIDQFTLSDPCCSGFGVADYPSVGGDVSAAPGTAFVSQFVGPCYDTAPSIIGYPRSSDRGPSGTSQR